MSITTQSPPLSSSSPPLSSPPLMPVIKRSSTWVTQELNQFLADNANAQFVWGTLDCSLFAADAIKAMTGVDIAADFRGKYNDKASAFALIHTLTGGTTVADAAAYCANKYGLVEWKHPLCAQRGDLVCVDNGGTIIAGIVDLSGKRVACLGESGILRVAISNILCAWHVPS